MGLIEQIYEWIVFNSLTADLSNLLLKASEKELDTSEVPYWILSINVVLVVYIYILIFDDICISYIHNASRSLCNKVQKTQIHEGTRHDPIEETNPHGLW